jgi:hypothetical protein
VSAELKKGEVVRAERELQGLMSAELKKGEVVRAERELQG